MEETTGIIGDQIGIPPSQINHYKSFDELDSGQQLSFLEMCLRDGDLAEVQDLCSECLENYGKDEDADEHTCEDYPECPCDLDNCLKQPEPEPDEGSP